MKITLMVFGCPSTPTHPDYAVNAFSTNVLGVLNMLSQYDEYRIMHFGTELSEVPKGVEHVSIVTEDELTQSYGDNWKTQKDLLDADGEKLAMGLYDVRAKHVVPQHVNPDELTFLLNFVGPGAQVLFNELGAKTQSHVVEAWVGYPDTYAQYRVFPSAYWQSFHYGRYHQSWEHLMNDLPEEDRAIQNPLTIVNHYSFCKMEFDAVIPHALDMRLFTMQEEKEDWFLHLSRIIPSKGINEAVEATRRTGHQLKIAGAGDFERDMGYKPPPHVEILGTLKNKERNEIMGKAKGFFAYTLYGEVFGYAPVEASACGTPVLASNYGAFRETIQNGINGYRANNVDELVDNIDKIGDIKPQTCRKWVEDNYSYEAVAPQYHAYLQRLGKFINGN